MIYRQRQPNSATAPHVPLSARSTGCVFFIHPDWTNLDSGHPVRVFAFSRYEATLTMPARPCTIQRAPRMISSVSGENRSSGSPRADFLAHRSPYPLMLLSWASGARQPAYPAGRLSPAVGPHDPGW
jgi:hypothetical protein